MTAIVFKITEALYENEEKIIYTSPVQKFTVKMTWTIFVRKYCPQIV